MQDTLSYYDGNADDFVESTFEVSMEDLYREFLPQVPEGGHILDAGCGSGRDALFFKIWCYFNVLLRFQRNQ